MKKRICSIDNETLKVVAQNCVKKKKKRDRVYLEDVQTLLEKALEGITDKKDLCDSEKETIKRIRKMIKGL